MRYAEAFGLRHDSALRGVVPVSGGPVSVNAVRILDEDVYQILTMLPGRQSWLRLLSAATTAISTIKF